MALSVPATVTADTQMAVEQMSPYERDATRHRKYRWHEFVRMLKEKRRSENKREARKGPHKNPQITVPAVSRNERNQSQQRQDHQKSVMEGFMKLSQMKRRQKKKNDRRQDAVNRTDA